MTSNPISRKFTPLDILNRAAEYGIRITLADSNLTVDVPAVLEGDKKYKALEVIRANRLEIIDFLQKLVCIPLCFTCLDEDKETPALPDDCEGIMYCAAHHPAYQYRSNSQTSVERFTQQEMWSGKE